MTAKVEFAFLADYAMICRQRLSACMIMNELVLPETPWAASFFVAGVLHCPAGSIYKVDASLFINHPEPGTGIPPKKLIHTVPGQFDLRKFRGSNQVIRTSFATPFQNIVFLEPGKYSVEIVVDDLCIHTLDLLVKLEP